jgi:soluble lytic murein transglycosylase-like protein
MQIDSFSNTVSFHRGGDDENCSRNLLCILILALLASGCSVLEPLGLDEQSEDRARVEAYRSVLETADSKQAVRGSYFMPAQKPAMLPPLNLTVTPEVQKELNHFRVRDSAFVKKSLKRLGSYEPVLKQIFADEGVPAELINVAMVESAFNPKARSGAGALGMWQFMRSTGRIYGLKSGVFGDQRKDPVLSTIAAARHLRDLYISYKDWHLALAAYNAGPGRVDRAMRRVGSKNFWVLCRKRALPLQTRRYVPKVVAAAILSKNLGKFSSDQVIADRE